MKSLLLILFSIIFAEAGLLANDTISLRFEEKLGIANQAYISIPQATQSSRLRNSRYGNIVSVMDYDQANNFHPLSKAIIENAVSSWCEQLHFENQQPVKITFQFVELNSDIAYSVVTHYKLYGDGFIYPLPLYIALTGEAQETGEDIIVSINNNKSLWFFEGDQDGIKERNDFKAAILRAVAQTIGFRTSLANTQTPRYSSTLEYRTKFDNNVLNSNNATLGSFTNSQRADILAFATGDNVFWKTANTGYKLYAPSTYVGGVSLNYFDSQNELMSYNFKSNQSIYAIDSKTIQILNDIGWKEKEKQAKVTINCPNIDSTGLANTHNSYFFTGISSSGNISTYQWEYRIKKKDGTFVIINSSSNNLFTINPIIPASDYARNSDGNIVGEIHLLAVVNGTDIESSFNIYLRATPAEINYSYKIIEMSDWEFAVELTIESKGAEAFDVTMRDWDTGLMYTRNYLGYQYVKFISVNFDYGDEIQFQIKATNQNGYKETYLNLPIIYNGNFLRNGTLETTKKSALKTVGSTPASFDVYSYMGLYVGSVKSREELFDKYNSGIYLLRSKDKYNNVLSSEKIILNK